ncbi:MAG: TspO/MBR family protein [Opitutaceae bacterium]
MNHWLALFLFLLASFTASAIGGYATFDSVRTWYPTLVKPAWNPPAAIFGPAWTLLYALMSVAAWRVWSRRAEQLVRPALRLFFLSLGLNTLWSILFFGLHRPAWALADIVLLWFSLVMLQFRFGRIDRVAGWLWAPYLAWVTFAFTLNAGICWLN